MALNNPSLLLFETSGPSAQVGLAQGHTLLSRATVDRGRQHARDLIPTVERLCIEQQWRPSNIDAVAVSIGPGSYTGLRVGIMTAKTLAYALNKPLLAIPTFDIIAHQNFLADPTLSSLTIIADGQQDKVYVQTFTPFFLQGRKVESKGGTVQDESPESPLNILPGESWRSSLTTSTVLTGPGLRQQQHLLSPAIRLLPADLWDPKLTSLLSIALSYINQHKFCNSFTLEPLYLRASAAEEQWTALGK
jgi:tRNA threonylcarbamoyladenosine biosynthesis protein TsaB